MKGISMQLIDKKEQRQFDNWFKLFGSISCLSEEIEGIVEREYEEENIDGIKHALIKSYAKIEGLKIKDVNWEDVLEHVRLGVLASVYLLNAAKTVSSFIRDED